MSASGSTSLDIQEQVARIERTINEASKFSADRNKLAAEADKIKRERFLAPILEAGALGGAIAAAVPSVLRSWGLHRLRSALWT